MHQAPILDFALTNIILARSDLYASSDADSHLKPLRAHVEIEEAIKGLRQAGTQHHLPHGLLTRS